MATFRRAQDGRECYFLLRVEARKVTVGPISYLISATEMKPRSTPVNHTPTVHAAYWRRHTAPLGLPTALDVGKEVKSADFRCFSGWRWANIGFWALSPRSACW